MPLESSPRKENLVGSGNRNGGDAWVMGSVRSGSADAQVSFDDLKKTIIQIL